jgi:hypothetical protein
MGHGVAGRRRHARLQADRAVISMRVIARSASDEAIQDKARDPGLLRPFDKLRGSH